MAKILRGVIQMNARTADNDDNTCDTGVDDNGG